MFEAHYLNSEDYQPSGSSAPCWNKTYHREHQTTQRPLKIWFAEGKRVTRQGGSLDKSFVYIEYKNTRGADRYRCLEIVLAGQSLGDVLQEAVQVELLED